MFRSTSALMTLAHIEIKRYKPRNMAIKKALYGRQPGSFYFFSFIFVALEREYFLCFIFVSFL
jgi:hypothetical protein